MKIFYSCVFASILTITSCVQVTAGTIPSFSTSAKELTVKQPVAIVKKREVTPGKVTFTRQNGCWFQTPISKSFLEDGTTLETPFRLAISGNNIPQWRSELKKPWQSKLTDYRAGEYKFMLFQIGQHLPTIIKVEESDKQLLNAETACNIATYQIFKNNLSLLKPISQPGQNFFSLSMARDWERYFYNYSKLQIYEENKTDKFRQNN